MLTFWWKKVKLRFPGCRVFENTRKKKTFSQIPGLVVVLVLESKDVIVYCNFKENQATLRWLNTVFAVCECQMSFAKSWREKGCSSQGKTWQVKNILLKNFDWQVKFDVFVVCMATWTIEYNLKISLLLSLHKIRSLDFPTNLHTAYYNHHHFETYLTKF